MNIVGLELLVPDIDAAVAVFSGVLGFRVAHRGHSPDVPAEVVVLDGGPIALTLIQPIESDGAAFPDPTPRLSQLVVDTPDMDSVVTAVTEAGLSVESVGANGAFVPPAAMHGVVGFQMALVFRSETPVGSESSSEPSTLQ